MTTFLPDGYEPPKTPSNYMKFEVGENKFRVVCEQPVIGYEYWTAENKPVRLKELPDTEPKDLRKGQGKEDHHWLDSIKHFWAFTVWNYKDERIQILEITQTTIQNGLTGLFKNKEWGHPSKYDVSINAVGEKMTREYAVMPNPHKDQEEHIKTAARTTQVNLEALFDGSDPFAKKDTVANAKPSVAPPGVSIDQVPF